MRSLFSDTQRPSAWPAEVLDRLLRYDVERRERMAAYEQAWERKWKKAATAPVSLTAMWRLVK